MKILIIHEIDWIKKVVFEPHHFAELFSMKEHDVYVIDCREPDLRNLIEGFKTVIIPNYSRIYKGANITIIRPPSLLIKGLNRLTNFLTCSRVIKRIITEKNIDIILLYGVATNGIQTIKIAKEEKKPVVFRALDVAHGLVKIPLVRQLAKKCEKSIISNANEVLTTTNDLARYAIEMGADGNNVNYFPLGINLREFRPIIKDLELAQNLGVSLEDKVIVFIGTIYDFSGLDLLINEFEKLKNNVGKIKLLIVGGGTSFTKIQSLVKERKLEQDVILTGFKPQNQLPRYISLADICVNPFEINYVTERILPTKILEYLACGKPVLSTLLKGTKELLPTNEYGIVYSSSDKFVDTLSSLICDSKKLDSLGKKGYAYITANHDWDVLTEQLLGKFEKLIHSST